MKRTFALLISVLAVSCLFFNSCEVGLGESVDTEAPKLAITYPPESAVIMQSFVLSGTCSDDIGVNKVLVTVKKASQNSAAVKEDSTVGAQTKTLEAEIDKDTGTWSVTLNNKLEDNAGYNGWEYAVLPECI